MLLQSVQGLNWSLAGGLHRAFVEDWGHISVNHNLLHYGIDYHQADSFSSKRKCLSSNGRDYIMVEVQLKGWNGSSGFNLEDFLISLLVMVVLTFI